MNGKRSLEVIQKVPQIYSKFLTRIFSNYTHTHSLQASVAWPLLRRDAWSLVLPCFSGTRLHCPNPTPDSEALRPGGGPAVGAMVFTPARPKPGGEAQPFGV